MASEPIVLTPDEVAEYLRVDRETVYRQLRAKRLPGNKIGQQWRIRKADLDDYLAGMEWAPILDLVVQDPDLMVTGRKEILFTPTGVEHTVHLYDRVAQKHFTVKSAEQLQVYIRGKEKS